MNKFQVNGQLIDAGALKKYFGPKFGNWNVSNKPPPRHDTPPSPCRCRCGEKNDDTRIVGGKPSEENEFPWMARLSYFNRFYCGGMLINDRYVLTAAHCVKGFMWFMIKVTFGEHNRCDDKKRPESRFVLRAIIGAFSFHSFDHDIALLRLNDRVPITQFIKPICLPSDKNQQYVGAKGTASGWGTLKEDGKPSCVLQKVDVPVMSNKDCRNTNYSSKMISDNMLCAGYPDTGKKDSCQVIANDQLRRRIAFRTSGTIKSWAASIGRAASVAHRGRGLEAAGI
nr:unnamed protein product [Callosobruchus analis]